MRVLPDTHAIVWFQLADRRLSDRARDLLAGENDVLLSAVVPWEIAIKSALGKLRPVGSAAELIERGMTALPITLEHAAAIADLPPHHRDPFDRMLIAQAQTEGATIVSADPHFSLYNVPVAW